MHRNTRATLQHYYELGLLDRPPPHRHITDVVFDYGDDVVDLKLPVGAQASIAIYTERLHALSILRKIVLRIKSWENYVF